MERDKDGDEKSLDKIIEEICFIYDKEPSKSAPSILRSSITALTTSPEESRLSHIISMLDAKNLKFPMISEDECKQLGSRYDSKGEVYPIHVKDHVKFKISSSLGVFKRVMENNEKYAIRQKRICIKERLQRLERSDYLGNSERIENWLVYGFALQLSDALMYCHETAGIIYRSLGPRSVLIYDHCNKLKLYDFTLSREPVPDGTRGLGAPGFQAPEMMDTLDKDSCGYNVDFWSYAMMIFFIIRNGEEHVENILGILDGEVVEYKSIDEYDPNKGFENLDPDIYNTITPSGMPLHNLCLKLGL